MVSFELKDAAQGGHLPPHGPAEDWSSARPLSATSTRMMLYPVMSSHREISPKHRERMGIGENLVRLSVGIEDFDDIAADLSAAFAQ